MCIGGIMECYVGLVMNRVACLPFWGGGNGYHTLSKTANHHFASAAHDDTS